MIQLERRSKMWKNVLYSPYKLENTIWDYKATFELDCDSEMPFLLCLVCKQTVNKQQGLFYNCVKLGVSLHAYTLNKENCD